MGKKHLLSFLLLVAGFPYSASSQLIINELMQSNIDCIMDDINEFPDSWVELYNNGSSAVNLEEYSIGLTEDAASSWKLPYRQIGSHQYVLVYCDKEAKILHTDFKLDSGKGSVFLFRQGNVVDKVVDLKKQPAPNIAYGRRQDADEEWGYQYTPTPQATNCGRLCQEILGEPIFSEKGVVKTNNTPLQLTLSLPENSPENSVIKITTNGSEPTLSSTTYTTPLSIKKTTVVKAKIFCEGYLSPRATAHSYIFFPRALTLPVVSLVTDSMYFYDNKIGIYVDGTYQNGNKNYIFDWRRPVNIEYFEREDEESEINQLCETRIQGGASRDHKLKSLAVYANKRFGKKRLDYEFFPDQKPGITDFKSVILRNAGNDFDYLYMRDAIIQRTMGLHTDIDWQAWRPAIVFINGTYLGILNIRERSNEDNIYSNYDGLEDIDMIENWEKLKAGDTKDFEAFKAFYAVHGHTIEEYEKWMDWKEFINLMVMNLYFNNQDFPGNNFMMWRPRSDNGVWRFVAKDTDFGLGLYGSSPNYNTIEWIYKNNYDPDRNWANKLEHTRLFRQLMEVKEFKREFIDRAAIYMGDFLNAEGTREYWDPMYEMIKTEYPYHRELINKWWPNYSDELTAARNWIEARTGIFYKHLANYYQLGTPIPLQINPNAGEEERHAMAVSMNGITLSKSRFDGMFFANRMLHVTSEPKEDRQVTGWTVIKVTNNGTTTENVTGPSFDFQMPECQKVIIMAHLEEIDGIEEHNVPSFRWKKEGDMLTLEGVSSGQKVSLYQTNGILLKSFSSDGLPMHIPLPHHEMVIVKIGHQILKVK